MKKDDYCGIHPNTYKMLFTDKKEISKEELGTEENQKIIDTLNIFTRINHKTIFIF